MCKTLEVYFSSFVGQYDAKSYRAHLEDLVQGLLLHLDDPSAEIQEAVLGMCSALNDLF